MASASLSAVFRRHVALHDVDVDVLGPSFNRVVDDFGKGVISALVPASDLRVEGGCGIEELKMLVFGRWFHGVFRLLEVVLGG